MFTFSRKRRLWAFPLIAASLLTAFSCESPRETLSPSGQARLVAPITFWVLTDGNQIMQFRTDALGSPMATVNVTGLATGDRLLGIDFRPANGQLYAVSNGSRIYTINTTTGAASMVGSGPFSPGVTGDAIGLDFNPTVDRIRLVSNSGQNLRLHPDLGTVVATDGNINGAGNLSVSGSAYTNNFAGATTTTLYSIDPGNDKLYRQVPPNDGTQIEVGALNVNTVGAAGFDIGPSGEGIAVMGRTGSASELYEIDLNTGGATLLGSFPSIRISIIGLAIPTASTPPTTPTGPLGYAVDGLNRLMIFSLMSPGTPTVRNMTGLQSGEMLVGIDFRPANGQLYGVSTMNRIYTINTTTGAVTAVGGSFGPMNIGTDVGFDFNPTVDRIRLVTSSGINLRLNPDTGGIAATDGNLNPGSPSITAGAYTNNFVGATTTTLYTIDSGTNKLFRQVPPNDGTQVEVGSLGFDVEGANGFDISSVSNTGYALLRSGVMSGVYRIDLNTGAATSIATFPAPVQAMSVGLGF